MAFHYSKGRKLLFRINSHTSLSDSSFSSSCYLHTCVCIRGTTTIQHQTFGMLILPNWS